MIKEKKAHIIEELKELLNQYNIIYLADLSNLNAKDTSDFRRDCYKSKISLRMVKNTLIKKVIKENIQKKDLSPFFEILSGNTCILTSEVNSAPARIIKKFREKFKKKNPLLKGAYVEESFYLGDDQLENLTNIKTKEELLGDLISLLQSPIKNTLCALASGGQKISGALKTLSEKS